ncbi:MAG: GNAT family N-acetyltransferase [Gammaproteobacteria bacterium]|nr:GNAT family N-acetyltransferase [Gammaproteobacteria bacterium]
MSALVIKNYQGTPLHSEVKKIRQIVFIDEQKVSEELEWDDEDKISTHLVVYQDNKAIASARYYKIGHITYIGRMAVLLDYRRQGVGYLLLKKCIDDIKKTNTQKIIIHAQETVLQFYQQQGFIEKGEKFYEADIAHKKMILELT